MSSGFDEVSLAVFTTLAPAGAVAFMVLAAVRIFMHDKATAQRLDRAVAVPFAVALLGFVISATHLGTPANALYVLLGVGRSPLSNEVLAAAVFLGAVGTYWLASFGRRFPDWLARAWLAVACGVGAVFLWCTSLAYSVSTVPTWNTSWTPLALVAQGFANGFLMAMPLLRIAGVCRIRIDCALVVGSAAAMTVNVVAWNCFGQAVSTISNNELSALSLVPHFGGALASYAVLGVAALALAVFACFLAASLKPESGRFDRKRLMVFGLRVLSCLIMLFTTLLLRWTFYQLHMTVGW